MKVVRNNVFETNSSTTHSLVLFDQIKACGISVDNDKTVTITLVPLFDNSKASGEDWQNNIINSLNHVSYMVDYIYTRLMLAKYREEPGFIDKSSELIDKMQKYLIELGYEITYKQPLIFNDELDNYDKIYVEYNDGSYLEYIDEFEEILESINSFKDYIENYVWVIDYQG